MSYSKTSISNNALLELGEKIITDFDNDTSSRAVVCQQKFDLARDITLASFPWPFAGKRKALARESASPLFGWTYKYPLPSDYISGGLREIDGEPDYLLEGGYILCDEDGINISYTWKHDDPSQWPATFVQLMVYRLAEAMAMPLTGKRTLKEDMHNLAREYEVESLDLESRAIEQGDLQDNDDLINAGL